MSALREEIRAILREEIAALRTDAAPRTERVRIATGTDLTRFVQDLVRRAADPDFAARVMRGDLRFEPTDAASPGAPIVTSVPRGSPATLDKPLVTERDITALGQSARSLRIAAHSRLTPLARDEARRRGIRIERSER